MPRSTARKNARREFLQPSQDLIGASTYLFRGDALDHLPPPLRLTHVGDGNPDGFIFHPWAQACGAVGSRWIPTDSVVVQGGESAEEYRRYVVGNQGVDPNRVADDLHVCLENRRQRLGGSAHKKAGVFIKAPTDDHAGLIEAAAEEGAELVLCEKPTVRKMAEVQRMEALHRRYPRLVTLTTYQHARCAPPMQMAEIVQQVGPAGVADITVAMRQKWLQKKPLPGQGLLQASHRVIDPLTPVADLGGHAGHTGSVVAGSPIVAVELAQAETTGEYGREAGFFDKASCRLFCANGIRMNLLVTQAEEGQADNLYVVLHLADGTDIAFVMEWGVDAMWVAKRTHSLSIESPTGWGRPKLRGFDPIYSARVNAMFPFSPGGHVYGWLQMMIHYLIGTYGFWLQRQSHPVMQCAGASKALTVAPVGIQEALDMTRFILAFEKSAQENGRHVRLEEFKS